MASSVSSVALIPISPFTTHSTALRPVEAGVPTAFDADALRRGNTLQSETTGEARPEEASDKGGGAGSRQADPQPASGRPTPASNAAFVAQLLAQDQPAERRRSPFADAARAYRRLSEEPKSGFVLDPPQRIDLKA